MMNVNDLNGTTSVKIAGENVQVAKDAPTKATLRKCLEERGIDSFTVLVDGKELLTTNDLPNVIGDSVIEVQRNVKSG